MKKMRRPRHIPIPTKLLKILGENLLALRIERGQTIKQVASKVEISARIISQIEKGKYDLWLTQLFDLGEYYNVKPSTLLEKKQ